MAMRRRGLVLLGGLLVAGCAAPRPPVTFEPLAPAQAALVRNVHAHGQTSLCQGCHQRGAPAPALLHEEPVALCKSCHRFAHGNHPVEVAMKRPSGKLPLWKGQVTCVSCHDPHAVREKRGLRAADAELCLACHARH